ncbi:zinc ribbon domain-containing protein [Staphylococcus pettenkoferi]|uniref:zinc-ribbon domain-containing protein n=1 Tax=Staphylococcus pettenkoferi TaxID=170573 RepID=UPI001C8B361A|nr:zinc ribbon domain-containing protein [Staphylococcus pettenkoferi]MBX8994261.1 zinc ribbon domain-containing protein [Staphylococcus pettenkoferi]
MVFCTNCGHKNSENQKFCVNCGAPLRNANVSQQTSQNQDKEQTQSQQHDSQHTSTQQQHHQGGNQGRAHQATQSSASQSYGAHQQTRQTPHTYQQEPDKRGGSKVWIVISTIIFLAIFAALIFGAYKLYDHYTNKSDDHKQSQHASKKDSNKSKSMIVLAIRIKRTTQQIIRQTLMQQK